MHVVDGILAILTSCGLSAPPLLALAFGQDVLFRHAVRRFDRDPQRSGTERSSLASAL